MRHTLILILVLTFTLCTHISSSSVASGPSFQGMPYRQDDPKWANDTMWNRDSVIRVDTGFNGHSHRDAESLLRKFEDGNTIGNEGCLLTSLAMVLRLFHPEQIKNPWTPKSLNAKAQELYYYTRSGLSMTALYADLVTEVTHGKVQLIAKEEYLSGEKGWPKKYVNTSALVRAYRGLSPEVRRNQILMIKTGTYDDTVASHYLLLHPGRIESVDSADPEVLDPSEPLESSGPWRLSDSSKSICKDPEIKKEWVRKSIETTQIAGVWVFAKSGSRQPLNQPLIRAWASELAK